MNVPIPFMHKSHAGTLKRCSKQLELKNIFNLPSKFVLESAICGSAFHAFTEEIYKSKLENKWDNPKHWILWFVDDVNRRKEEVLANDQELNEVEDIKAEEFAEMIIEFLKQPWNRYAEPILLEAPFRFWIKRGRTKYGFEGRIDQLLRIKWEHLPPHFVRQLGALYDDNELGDNKLKPYIYIHRDIKTGARKTTDEVGLTINENIMFYSYALAHGLFDLTGGSNYTTHVKHVPFAHALYFVRDHLKYKRKTGDKQVGDPKGQGMYFVRKTLEDLKYMEEELINLWKKANNGNYTRDGEASNLCQRYCGWKDACMMDWRHHGN